MLKTGYKSTPYKKITGIQTLEECCNFLHDDNSAELSQYQTDTKTCSLFKSYLMENELQNKTNSTLLSKKDGIFNEPIQRNSENSENMISPSPSGEDEKKEVVIPPGKSEWEIIKVINNERRDGEKKNSKLDFKQIETFVGNNKKESFFRPSLKTGTSEQSIIQSNYSFNPTIVSLSSDPEGLHMGPSSEDVKFSSHEVLIPIPKGKKYAYKIAVYQTGFCMDSVEKKQFLGVETRNTELGLGEIYSDEIELGESIQQIVMGNNPPLMVEPVFKEPKVERPIIKFFEPKEGDSNSIIRIVGLKLDELEYFSFRDTKIPILKKQERIIGNIKYQEYLFKVPSLKDLDRDCWQSIEKYKVLVWGYYHGYQIISSEGDKSNKKMFTYNSLGNCDSKKK